MYEIQDFCPHHAIATKSVQRPRLSTKGSRTWRPVLVASLIPERPLSLLLPLAGDSRWALGSAAPPTKWPR